MERLRLTDLIKLLESNIKVLVTGITVNNAVSSEVHRKENGINILGGTHYPTEKFAVSKCAVTLRN